MKKGVKKIKLTAFGIFEKTIWQEPTGKELHIFIPGVHKLLKFKWTNKTRTTAELYAIDKIQI